MKDIRYIGRDLSEYKNNVLEKIINAQRITSQKIWEDLSENANMETGAFISSIQIDKTKYDNNTISTFIGSDLSVYTKDGKSYNLGYLLETGTSPHAIPNAFNFGEIYGYDSEMYKRTLDPDWHPGTRAYNNYRNALNNSLPDYRRRIKEALKK